MKKHIICHMVATIDGRIEGDAFRSLVADGEYERMRTRAYAITRGI